MRRFVASFVLLIFAAGIAAEACGPSATSSSAPGGPLTAEPTIPLPDGPARTPSGTIEVPPPID
jgi:hypothetical protein